MLIKCTLCSIEFEKITRHTCKDGKHRCKKCAQSIADKKYYAKNRNLRIEQASKWNKENNERRRTTTKLYLESEHGRNVVNEKQRKRYWKNPEYYRLRNRARVYGIPVSAIVGLKRDECTLCGTDKDITVDHMHPQSHGGVSNIENLQALCFKCNVWKSDKLFLANGGGYLVGESYGRA